MPHIYKSRPTTVNSRAKHVNSPHSKQSAGVIDLDANAARDKEHFYISRRQTHFALCGIYVRNIEDIYFKTGLHAYRRTLDNLRCQL